MSTSTDQVQLSARFSDGTEIRVQPGDGPHVIINSGTFGLTESDFRMAVNSLDADCNEQVDG